MRARSRHDSPLSVSGNGELLGAFVGTATALNGTGEIHYDQTLEDTPRPPRPIRLVAKWT